MTVSPLKANLLPCLGLVLGPVAWAANTQLGQLLPGADCSSHVAWLAATSGAGAVITMAAAALSWRSARPEHIEVYRKRSVYPHSLGFVGLLSALAGLIFTLVLLYQGASSLVLSGCER